MTAPATGVTSDQFVVDDAKTRVLRALIRIRSNSALMGIGTMLSLVGEYVEVPESMCPTMATDGRKVYYSSQFVDSITDAELRFVLIHEAMHIAYGHHLRIGDRRPDVSNIAMDHIINNQLKESSAFRSGFIDMPMPESTMHDPKYADSSQWNYERVYADIIDRYPKPPDNPGNKPGNKPGDNPGDSPAGMPERPGGMENVSAPGEVWPSRETDPKAVREEERKIQQKLAEGHFMEKSWGQGAGSDDLCGRIIDGRKEDVRGWQFMKDLFMQVYGPERTWSRPNVVFEDIGYYPSRKLQAGTVHFVIDTSGSVSPRELETYMANAEQVCLDCGISKVRVAYVDADIHRNDHGEIWTEFDIAQGDKIEFEIRGRGGTDFTPIFEAIDEEMEDVQCLVYFTDGWGSCYADEPDFPVVWATTNGVPRWWKNNADFETAGFGHFAPITMSEY